MPAAIGPGIKMPEDMEPYKLDERTLKNLRISHECRHDETDDDVDVSKEKGDGKGDNNGDNIIYDQSGLVEKANKKVK